MGKYDKEREALGLQPIGAKSTSPNINSSSKYASERQALTKPPTLTQSSYQSREVFDMFKEMPEQAKKSNPVIGEEYFSLNAFPMRQNDNLLMKGLKGVGNFAASTIDAPLEVMRKLSIQGGNILTGKGIQPLPKNTSFVNDILPKGASDTLRSFEEKSPILGGLARMGVDTIADPTTFLGAGVVKNTARKVFTPQLERNLIDPALTQPIKPIPEPLKAPSRRVDSIQIETPSKPKSIAQNALQKIESPKVMASNIEQPALETSISEPLLKNRQFAENSVLNSQVAPDMLKQDIKENLPQYEQLSNKVTFDKATSKVGQNYTKAVQDFTDAKGGVNADDVALGEALITKAIRDGNTDEANRLIADLAEKLTTAGQAVQAASIFKRLTPEGMLLYAQRMVNRANRDLFERLGENANKQKIVLTPEDSEFILSKMKEVQKLPEGRKRTVEMARVMRLIADKVPSTLGERIKAVQRDMMLSNPRTAIKNIGGNIIMGGLENIKDVVGTPVDMLTSKLTGQRTTTIPSATAQLKGGLRGLGETVSDQFGGLSVGDLKGKNVGEQLSVIKEGFSKPINTYQASTQWEIPKKTVFQGKGPVSRTMNLLDRAVGFNMEIGDRPFYNAALDDSLNQMMRLNKTDSPTPQMLEQAKKIAEDRTFQSTNAITRAGKQIHDALNLGKSFGLGDFVLPFVKTPANILNKAIQYSPAGLGKAVEEAVNLAKKNGKFDQKAFVDSISRSVTGSGVIMAGYALAEKGVITGTGNKDKDIASFERNLGKSDFAVKLGDKYFTYDWAQPASMALAVGADMYLKGKTKKEAENAVIEGIKSGGETLLKQSFLQGIQKMFGGYAPMDNLEATAYSAPAQFIPTISSQITQLTDPIKRSTYGGSLPQNTLNSIKSKIPGQSKTLEPSIDVFGKPVQQYQGKNNFPNVFLNPARSTEFKPNDVQKEIIRIYESTGSKDVFPKVAPRSFTNKGETINLTPKEITKFQQTMGSEAESNLRNIINKNTFDDQKAKLMAAAIQKAYENAKAEILRDRAK